MTASAFALHLAFCACLAAQSAAIVWAMTRVGVIDTPGSRSSHTHPTPKGGGVGIVAAFLTGIAALYLFASFSRLADPYFRGVILGAIGIAIVAYLDDVLAWPARVKLATQIAAAAVAVVSGLTVQEIRAPVIGAVELGWLGSAGTLAWIVIATNALNFIDGLNGLAAGVSAITCLFLAAIAASVGSWFVYFAALILAAGLLGFLPFNFPRARIFMGDVGSQFCGFMLAVLAIAAGRFEAVEVSISLVPMMLFGVLFDVAFTLIRRLFGRQRLMEAHRGHLYQVAHRSGMSAVVITLLHWSFAIWGGLCCLGLAAAGSPWKAVWVLMVVPPQAFWLAWVHRRAKRAAIAHW